MAAGAAAGCSGRGATAPVDDGGGDVVGHVGEAHERLVAGGVEVELGVFLGEAVDGEVVVAVIGADDPEEAVPDGHTSAIGSAEIFFGEVGEGVLLFGEDGDDVLFRAALDRGGLQRGGEIGGGYALDAHRAAHDQDDAGKREDDEHGDDKDRPSSAARIAGTSGHGVVPPVVALGGVAQARGKVRVTL